MLVVVTVVIALALALAAWSIVFFARDRAVVLRQLIAASVVEGALVVQMVVAGVLMATTARVSDPLILWSYLIFLLFVLPGVAVVAVVERSRWSSLVLTVGALTVVAMQVRVWQLWEV